MKQRLEAELKIAKENNIEDYRKAPSKDTLAANIAQTKFFSNCENYFKNVVADARNQQQITQKQKKIERQFKSKSIDPNEKEKIRSMQFNLVVDFLRSENMNYSYSVVMREFDKTIDEVFSNKELTTALNLLQEAEASEKLRAPALELMLQKLKKTEDLRNQKLTKLKDSEIQVEIITAQQNGFSNNMLLSEIKLAEIRQQVERRQKKYYESQVHSFKEHELVHLKDQMLKMHDLKQQKIAKDYEKKFNDFVKTGLSSNQVENQKRQKKYLTQIQELTREIRNLKQKVTELEHEKATHECMKSESVVQLLQATQKERRQLKNRREQFELALRNMDTKIEDLVMQKNKIMKAGSQNDHQEFIAKKKQLREDKDYMIEKTYSMVKTFEIRVETLSRQNAKLLEENISLQKLVKRLKKQLNTEQESLKTLKHTNTLLNTNSISYPTKNAIVGVSEQQILECMSPPRPEKEFDEFTENSEDFQEQLAQKLHHNQKVNQLKAEMTTLKNKVRFLTMEL